MALFAYVRDNIGGKPRAGIAYVQKIRSGHGGIIGAILFVIGLAFYGVVFHLLWNILTTPAHAQTASDDGAASAYIHGGQAGLDIYNRLHGESQAAEPSRPVQYSPCRINGQPVPCQHFLSSNPDAMRQRDEWIRSQVQRNPNAPRRDDDRRDDPKDRPHD